MIRFWVDKIKFMCILTVCGCWDLVREEWKLTKKELDDAAAHEEEINREAAERLLKALQKKRG